VKCKFDATIAPTINNDVSEGYTVGSRWLDITNLKSYVCLDNTDGAAVWIENVVEGDMNKATYDTDEDGDIDVAAGGTEKSSWTLYAIPYLSGTTTFGEIPIGTAEYCLTVNAGETGYDWTLFDLSLYYLKTAIDTLSEVEAIYSKDIIDSDELAALKFIDLDDTPANYTSSSLKFVRVNAGETALEFAAETDPNVDTDAEIKAILVDEVTKTGTLTVGNLTKTNNATGVIEDAGVATETALTTDSDAKVPTSKAVNDFCETTKDYKGKNYYSALSADHTYSDNADTDSQPVGESVIFGDLLYFNWTDKEWKKAKANASTTMPGSRISLESKADGEACLMLVKGYIRDDSAFDFAGAMIYVSAATAGAMTSTAPSIAGNQLQRVGQAKSADILFFDPSVDVGEI